MKYIVVELKGNNAVVMDASGGFTVVRNRNYSVGQSLESGSLVQSQIAPAPARVYSYGNCRSIPVVQQMKSGGKTMKKVRIVAIAVSIALLLMGVGYAAWGQALPIGVQANTSFMNVAIVSASAPKADYLTAGTVVAPLGKAMGATVSNLYPGAQQHFKATIKNFSTMPVTLSSIAISNKSVHAMLGHFGPVGTLDDFTVGVWTTGQWYSLGWDLSNIPVSGVTLAPGASYDFEFAVQLNSNTKDNTQLVGLDFVITPNFTVGN